MVLMDVDGVMTDGGILFVDGRSEGRIFDVKDGVGVRLLHRMGILTGVISGRTSPAVRRRTRELRMDEVHLKVGNKLRVYEEILSRRNLPDAEVCFIGDDLMDLPVLKRVGFSVAVADAHPLVRSASSLVTKAPGGKGAIREVADLILNARGAMGQLVAEYEEPDA